MRNAPMKKRGALALQVSVTVAILGAACGAVSVLLHVDIMSRIGAVMLLAGLCTSALVLVWSGELWS